MKHRLSSTFLLVAVLALVGNPLWANHSWNGYHWARRSNPFTLKVGDNVESAWDSIVNTTISDWTKSSVLNMNKVSGQANRSTCRPTNGRVEVCNYAYGNNGWLGVGQIWVSGKHITQGTVKLNDTYFNKSTYNKTAWRNLVSCQEVGHTIGLDHQDENFYNANLGTCMDYTNLPGTNQHPNQHDYNELVTIYSHNDNFNSSFLPAPSAMYQIDFATPAQWGERVAQSDDGLTETYRLDFGGGNQVLTFVIWASMEERTRALEKTPFVQE